jgi:DNA-binding CsgD family transcriptional regulator
MSKAEVLQLIAAGMSNREIADRLGLTANTVKSHIKNIYGKWDNIKSSIFQPGDKTVF